MSSGDVGHRNGHGLSGLLQCAAWAGPTDAGSTCGLRAEQRLVLQAVAEGRIDRGYLLGDLEPHLLDGREVIGVLRVLVLRCLVTLRPIGPPDVTGRGRRLLEHKGADVAWFRSTKQSG